MLFAPADPRVTPTALPRSAVAFAALALGMVAARHLPWVVPGAWLSACCAACAMAGLVRGRLCRVLLVLAAGALGAGWFAVRIHEAPSRFLGLMLESAGGRDALITVEGVALESARPNPVERDPLHPLAHLETPSERFTLAVEAYRSGDAAVRVSGSVRVLLGGGRSGVRAGERVRVTGSFRPVAPVLNPGESDRRLWAAQEGEAGSVRVPRAELVETIAPASGTLRALHSAWLRWREAARERAHEALAGGDEQGSAGRALLSALLLGEEEPALREARSAFTRVGLAHALAISGFHLTVMAWLALAVLRLTGDRGWVEPAIVAAMEIAYLAILPVQAPIWRSGLLALGLLAADAAGRRYHPLSTLGWIGVALILWRPMDLWSMGFQLSFGFVAVLMWLGRGTWRRLFGIVFAGPRPLGRRAGPWAWDAARAYFASSLLCWVVGAPLVAYHTGLVSIAGLAAGLVILPPIVALLAAGYLLLGVGLVFPAASEASGAGLARVSDASIALVQWMDGWALSSVYLPQVSLAWAAVATAVGLYWFARGHVRDRAAWVGAIGVTLWLVLEVIAGPRLSPGSLLRVDTLAVGDGSCHLVRSGGWGGEAMLWDCGSRTPGIGRRVVPRAVRAAGAWRVPVAVISHPNVDHFNGLLDAAGPLGLERVLVGECFMEQASARPDGPEAYLLARLVEAGVEVRVLRAGDSFALGGATVTILSPPRADAATSTWADNDRSLVAEIRAETSAGARRVLLTGDIQLRAIEHLKQSRPGLRADVMEAPHHGSAHDPAIRFVAAVDPAVVLQSTGPERAGDARWETVRRFRGWYTTATDGAAWAEVRADGTIRSGAVWRR